MLQDFRRLERYYRLINKKGHDILTTSFSLLKEQEILLFLLKILMNLIRSYFPIAHRENKSDFAPEGRECADTCAECLTEYEKENKCNHKYYFFCLPE